MKTSPILIFVLFALQVFAQNDVPVISNLDVLIDNNSQIVKINYDLFDAEDEDLQVMFLVSDNKGQSYTINTDNATGDVGFPIRSGSNKSITWDASAVLVVGDYQIKLVADDLYEIDIQTVVNQVDSNRMRSNLEFVEGIRHRTTNPNHLEAIKDSIEQRFLAAKLDTYHEDFLYEAYTAQNIIGCLEGTTQSEKTYVIDAHFDTVDDTPGADDNGSGLAGLMEAVRVLAPYQFNKTLRFISFDLEESGYAGSLDYTANGIPAEETIEGVFNMEMIGYYSDEPNSQNFPAGFEFLYPDQIAAVAADEFRGNFITNIGDVNSIALQAAYDDAAAQYVPDLITISLIVPPTWQTHTPDLGRSDHSSFWLAGIPALMLTDGSEFRNPNYHDAGDTLETLNFTFMSNVVKAIVGAVAEEAGIQHSTMAEADFSIVAQNDFPVISNLDVLIDNKSQIVKINYDLFDVEDEDIQVMFLVSDNNGQSYTINTDNATGDVGFPVKSGNNKSITWDASGLLGIGDYKIKLVADDLHEIDIQAIVDQVDRTRMLSNLQFIEGIRHRTTNPGHLEAIKDSIEQRFLAAKLDTYREDFLFEAYTAQNIIGHLEGATQSEKTYVIDAHFDTVDDTPGADDNGSGLAGLMEVVRVLAPYRFGKTLRFISFDLEESGYAGSLDYTANSIPAEETIEGVFNMEMIGYYSDEPNSQNFPAGFEFLYPDQIAAVAADEFRGNFITNIGDVNSIALQAAYDDAAAQYVPDLITISLIVPPTWQTHTPDLGRSDHSSFWLADIPALMLTDGSEFRNPNYHDAGDTLETLNFTFMSNVVKAIVGAVAEEAGIQHSTMAEAGFSVVAQNDLPVITILSVEVDNNSQIVTINYDLFDTEGEDMQVTFLVSNNDGKSYTIDTNSATGDVGPSIQSGNNKEIIWDASEEGIGAYQFKLVADDLHEIDIQTVVDQVDRNRMLNHLQFIEGVRHRTANPGHLEAIKDSIEQRFLAANLDSTYRKDFLYEGYTAQNIFGRLEGVTQSEKTYVIDAHFDTVDDTPGADDNGSGVAGLMEAVRVLAPYRFNKTLRFISFDLEESEYVGSLDYTANGIPAEETIEGVFNMEMIGYYSDEPNSQNFPAGFELLYPDQIAAVAADEFRGNFITNIGDMNSVALQTAYDDAAAQYVPDLKTISLIVPPTWQTHTPDLGRSDHSSFWLADIPALMLTDGSEFRNPNYHTVGDTLETLNFTFMSNVVKAIVGAVAEEADIQHSTMAMGRFSVLLTDLSTTLDCGIQVSPIPTDEIIRLSFSNCDFEQLNLQVFDALGRLVIENVVRPNFSSTQELDVTALEAGLYLMKVSNGKQALSRRLVIH